MDDLAYLLGEICRHNRDGSYTTQGDRLRSLTRMARQLRALGFRNMRPTSLRRKHVDALVAFWTRKPKSAGTLKNRLAHLRWWAEKVGKQGAVPGNAVLGIPERRYVTNENKSRDLGPGVLNKIKDRYVRMSLTLQLHFGLRREESIKFQPFYADRGDHIVLKKSWAKGGRARVIPITSKQQRAALDQSHALAGAGSLIPPHRNYIEQRNIYDGECKSAGLSKMHGLRHGYTHTRYETLTGWKAPAAGGPSQHTLTPEQRTRDEIARQIITEELGHSRLAITALYLGR